MILRKGLFRNPGVIALVLLLSLIFVLSGCNTGVGGGGETPIEEEDPVTDPPPPVIDPTPPTVWTPIEDSSNVSPFTGTVYKVAFGNGKFVATGTGGKVWYSTDGVAWVASPSGITGGGSNNISGLGFCGRLFLATAGSSVGNDARAYSTDGGNTWTDSRGSDASKHFNAKGVAYGNGRYVIGGSAGKIVYSDDPSDDTSWTLLDSTQTTFTGANGYINSITFGGGKFIAVGGQPGDAAYSTDKGETWIEISQIGDIFNASSGTWINGVAYGGGKFVAVGEGGGIAAWSSNGINWTQVVYSTADPLFGEALLGVAYGNGYFVTVGNTGGVWYSSDGVSWTKVTTTTFEAPPSGSPTAINGVGYGNGKWVIVGNGGKAAYSTVTIGS